MRDPTRLSAMAGPIGLELVLAEPSTFVTLHIYVDSYVDDYVDDYVSDYRRSLVTRLSSCFEVNFIQS